MNSFFKFINSVATYTLDNNTVRIGEDGYKHSEWSATRQKSQSFYRDPTTENYLGMIFEESPKIAAAKNLIITR